MKFTILSVLALVSSLSASIVFAADSPAPAGAKYEQFFLLNGKRVSGEEAIMGSIKGTPAFKCNAVQATVSKSGTSVGIRAVKKPRVN